jgi:hypothetical protein
MPLVRLVAQPRRSRRVRPGRGVHRRRCRGRPRGLVPLRPSSHGSATLPGADAQHRQRRGAGHGLERARGDGGRLRSTRPTPMCPISTRPRHHCHPDHLPRSMKFGHTTASLLIARLHASSPQNSTPPRRTPSPAARAPAQGHVTRFAPLPGTSFGRISPRPETDLSAGWSLRRSARILTGRQSLGCRPPTRPLRVPIHQRPFRPGASGGIHATLRARAAHARSD